MNTKKDYVIIIASIIFIGISYYFGGLTSVISGFFAIFIYTIIAYGLSSLWKKLRSKPLTSISIFAKYFIMRIYVLFFVLISIVGGFAYYHNDISPANMPAYTLTNGEKTVYFQGMSHIASPQFYQGVQDRIASKKLEGYILFYEGVKPGSEENTKLFYQALGVQLESESYSQLSDLYGIVAQNNDDFLGIGDTPDYNVDLSLDEVIELYVEQVGEEGLKEDAQKEVLQIEEDLLSRLSDISPRQKAILQYLNQSIMNLFIKNDALRESILARFGTDIFTVILNDRNSHVANSIISSQDQNIMIIYGLLHYEGILELLQKADSNWKVINSEEYRLIF